MEVLYEQKTEEEEVELYSRENDDILGDVPGWLIYTGSYIMYGLIVLLLIGAALFEYPDVVKTPIVIDDCSNVEWVMANNDGLIHDFFVEDRTLVRPNDTLGIIQNPASLKDVKLFCQFLAQVDRYCRTNDISYLQNFPSDLVMGEMSDAYEQLTQSVRTCLDYQKLNMLSKRQEFLQKELCLQIESDNKNELAILHLKKEQFELAIKHKMEIQNNRRSLELSYVNMMNSLKNWESKYLIKSKKEGIILLGKSWSRKTFVNKGDTICSVVSSSQGNPVGRLFLAESEIADVNLGNMVQIELAKYPVHNFGYITGRVESISYVPSSKKYAVEVYFPNKSELSACAAVDYKIGLSGQAKIIKVSESVLERIFASLYRIFK